MVVIYAREPIPPTELPILFLAGPTPRSKDSAATPSWRPEALRILAELNYHGVVLTPEDRDGGCANDEEQIAWEENGLERATCIVFWIPRNLRDMHGLTTNIEWGRWERSGKIVLGAPEGAERVGYMFHYAKKLGVPHARDLRAAISSPAS